MNTWCRLLNIYRRCKCTVPIANNISCFYLYTMNKICVFTVQWMCVSVHWTDHRIQLDKQNIDRHLYPFLIHPFQWEKKIDYERFVFGFITKRMMFLIEIDAYSGLILVYFVYFDYKISMGWWVFNGCHQRKYGNNAQITFGARICFLRLFKWIRFSSDIHSMRKN